MRQFTTAAECLTRSSFPSEEYAKVQRLALGAIALHAQENTTIGEQAQQAALDALYGLGYDYHKPFDARIEAITLKDVVAVARKYFGNHVLDASSPDKES